MRNLFALMLLVHLSGCATLYHGQQDYRLQVGDKLKIVIFGEMDEQTIVRPDHKISLPIVGEISIRKKTPAQVSKELTTKYHMNTVVMVQEYHAWQAQLKEALGLARDVFLIFFAIQRIVNE